MKNIHVLSTDKPSRLHEYDYSSPMGLSKEPLQWRLGRNIYITSDEEIKEGDWFYDLDTKYVKVKQSWENSHLGFNGKKIILTTDQDLIGVQAIDDDFLNWFVAHPSCEFVIVELPKSRDNYISNEQYQKEHIWDTNVKIIIPSKEESKPFKDMLPLTEVALTEFKKNPVTTEKKIARINIKTYKNGKKNT